jgi:LAO/AO transport system kinase
MNNLDEKVLKGDVRGIARAISWIENENEGKELLLDALYPFTGRAVIWGITGPPGAGKSYLLNHLIQVARQKGKQVGVIAIDPSSPFSGGAILGDRLRMQKHATDPGVFIRSMASRGHLGGVAKATGDAIKVLDAAGFDLIIIETIGVGQTEIEVMELSDLVLLILVPGLGDEIQAMKAGVMEIGDIFVINKCDKDEAMKVKAEVEYVLGIKYLDHPDPVIMTSATHNQGIDELVEAIDQYLAKIIANGALLQRRKQQITKEINRIFLAKMNQQVFHYLEFDSHLDALVESVFQRKQSPYFWINRKLATFLKEQSY